MRTKMIWFMFFCFLIILSACTQGTSEGVNEEADSGTAGQENQQHATGKGSAGQGEASFKYRLAHTYPEGDIITAGIDQWSEMVAEETNGELQITVFPAGQLGGEREIMEALQVGTLEMAVTAFTGKDLFDSFFLPFMFQDTEHMWNVLRGPIGEDFNQRYLDDTGIRVLGYAYRSPRLLTANKEIKSPEDVQGMKIRVPEMAPYIATWEALGADPTPMAFPEVFSGLQQGVIDGQENPVELIRSSSFHEVQDYLILTEHVRAFFQAFINEGFWETLPEDIQQVVTDTWDVVADDIQAEAEAMQEESIKWLEEQGMTVIEVNQEEWKEATKDVWKDFTPEAWGEGMYEKVQAEAE